MFVSCGLAAAGVLYLDFFSFGKTEKNVLLICRRNKRLLIITAVFFTIFTYLSTAFAIKKRIYRIQSSKKSVFYLCAVCSVSYGYKEKNNTE